MIENYMKDEKVKYYYKWWINAPTLLEHSQDRELFYKFVKSCVEYVEHKDVFKRLDRTF